MQRLSIEAKSPESAAALLEALEGFNRVPSSDNEGDRYLVEFEIEDDLHALAVLDAAREHFASRLGDVPLSVLSVGVTGDEYSVHDR